MNNIKDFLTKLHKEGEPYMFLSAFRNKPPDESWIKTIPSEYHTSGFYKYIPFKIVRYIIEEVFSDPIFEIQKATVTPLQKGYACTTVVKVLLHFGESEIVLYGQATDIAYTEESLPLVTSSSKTNAIRNAVRDYAAVFGRDLNQEDDIQNNEKSKRISSSEASEVYNKLKEELPITVLKERIFERILAATHIDDLNNLKYFINTYAFKPEEKKIFLKELQKSAILLSESQPRDQQPPQGGSAS